MQKTGEKITPDFERFADNNWWHSGRSFLGDKQIGKMGEEALQEYFASQVDVVEVHDVSDTRRGIEEDVDFEVLYRDGTVLSVEAKTDCKAQKTGNLVFEERSHKNPGCFVKTKADVIAYFLAATGEVFLLNPERFRTLIQKAKEDKDFAASLGIRSARMGEGAFGYLVPIESIVKTDVVVSRFSIAGLKKES